MINLQEYLIRAASIDMPKNSTRVYMYMLSKIQNKEDYIHITQEEMRKVLRLSQPGIVKAVRDLSETGLIKVKKSGKYNYYQIT